MSDVHLKCPSCGAALRAEENSFHLFPQLRCPNKLPDGKLCLTFVDRRRADRRGVVVARALALTAEDTKLLESMGVQWNDVKDS